MALNIAKQVVEFIAAAGQSFSYNPRQNIYNWFGGLWGLPIPVVTILIQSHFLENSGVEDPFL